MATACQDCDCNTVPARRDTTRLLLSTGVEHTSTVLRSIARRRGIRLHVLDRGLLELQSDEADAFVTEARQQLTSVEAAEVRCLSSPVGLADHDLLAHAMRATSLGAESARLAHADLLLPLFRNEESSFYSVFQPIVELANGSRVGHEALLRATAQDGSSLMPDRLFSYADAAGWTSLLDRIARTTALRQAGPWLGEELLFINFVPTSIYRPEICLRTTETAARDAGLRLDQLVFEVTESHRVRDVDHLDAVFDYYRARGCRVALDDMGAGYSSLNLLLRLKPDVVKLDKQIVQALPDPVSCAMVTAIVTIAHAYGGIVLAECVETAEQAETALELGADLGQGWYFGRPVRPNDMPTAVDDMPMPNAV